MGNNLTQIPAEVIHRIPECVARENNIIPFAIEENVLRIAFAPSERDEKGAIYERLQLEDKLRFICQCPIALFEFPLKQIERAIDVHYIGDPRVENCNWKIKFECPLQWLSLIPTDNDFIRFCDRCSKNVYYCRTNEEVDEHAKHGHCVAIYRGPRYIAFVGEIAIDILPD